MTGIYVHIPFCKSRCIYCGFTSSTLGVEWQKAYVSALEKEISLRLRENGEPAASTVYIGGGTPSRLSPQELLRVVRLVCDNFPFTAGTEFTVEVNPDDVTPGLLDMLKDTPVNRISMGVQSLDDNLLRFLRRRHTARQAVTAIETFQRAGYGNISIDLIYGIPSQTPEMFGDDVRLALSSGITHLSAYALQIEQGTPLRNMLDEGIVEEADEELSLECYRRLTEQAEAEGMEHYEISNFSRPGFRSLHNSSYWQGTPYLGFGAGAHSYDGANVRTANTTDIREYIANPTSAVTERLTREELYDERVMLSLRTIEGLSLLRLGEDFGAAALSYCERQAIPHLREGTLERIGDTLRLTPSGLFVCNSIMADLMADA